MMEQLTRSYNKGALSKPFVDDEHDIWFIAKMFMNCSASWGSDSQTVCRQEIYCVAKMSQVSFFKLSKNFLFQTVKIFFFKLSKISFSKLSKFSFQNCQSFPFPNCLKKNWPVCCEVSDLSFLYRASKSLGNTGHNMNKTTKYQERKF